ncbi:hypothetical protein YC2023_067029 [Brassica napus]|uniref:(rape) hypothetical protein n=1 Tax=Brassica napus TaxID=3708 RepID=A0A816U7X3_BRANA|nr:unnamed protein product [Brassica napus]
MKACVIAAVIVKQSEGQTIEDNPVYKCLQKNPTNYACYNPGGIPRAANKHTPGCSGKHRCRGRRPVGETEAEYDQCSTVKNIAGEGKMAGERIITDSIREFGELHRKNLIKNNFP